ncbi:SusC/RagA family TonB-linked outer membrane protein [Gracilimonas mengyeensis]|uniref:TonB-linked outer membrane protein, SusC/RagA family n=1 Tax=Gracilimonas mengyeensis TaxID=1302730 RepID=A0A521EYR1_9BACT|nr:TonB-dependent receptor [Gracilimonas mengyeensis]SMO88591.1 TonB-linked outer membrane protein, SusC/RagA family [Gracilimonas mengyeensis]
MKKTILTLTLLLTWIFTYGQDLTVTGTVSDATDGAPLPGVNIVLEGTMTGTTSDRDGNYEITVPADTSVLVFSYIGYETTQVSVDGRSNIDVQLVLETLEGSEELVVVGYGTQKKSLVTGSISTVDSESITGLPVTRAEEVLEGRTAGVTVLPTSGSPGAGMQVRIRGTGSNQSSQPLYIVDGMKTGDINHLSPNDVESIEVLKDAASSAIYGAEGANGVVLITTKSGNRRGTEVSYELQLGVQSAGDITQPMNADQYIAYMTAAGNDVSPSVSGTDTDWIEQTFEPAPFQKHYLSFSGGNEASTYLFSGSYTNQDGIAGGDKANFERYSARLNSTHDIKDWLQVGNNLSYTSFDRSTIAEDDEFNGVISNALMFDPTVPVTYGGSPPSIIRNALDDGNFPVQNSNGEYYGVSTNVFGEIVNPRAMFQTTKGSTNQDKLLGNVYARMTPIENLEVTSRIGVDYASQLYHTWTPTYWYSSERLNSATNVRDNQDEWYTWLWENFAQYQTSFEKHNVSFLAGFSGEKYTHKYLTTLSGPMFKEGDSFAQHGATEIEGQLSGNLAVEKQSSYWGRINYDFDDRYLLEIAFRRDGTSLLAEQNRWGNFPSVSAGWVLSSEDFWTTDVLTFAKIRASWGQNGSLSNLSPDQYRGLITTDGLRYPNNAGGYYTGAEPDILANPELKWETSEQTNFGVELRALSDRLQFTADYYVKITKDLLTPGAPPLSVGNDAPFVNAGDVTNKGFEFEASFSEYKRDFSYNIDLSLSFNNNEVTYLNPLLERVSGTQVGTGWTATYFEEGKPIWYFRGYATDGIFQNQAEINAYLSEQGISSEDYNPSPGDPIVVNSNGDNLINAEDMVQIGNPHPDMVLGANLNFNYKGVNLGVFLSGTFGNDVLMGWNRVDRGTSNRPAFFYEDRWTGEGSTNSWFAPDTESPYAYNSDLMVFDGSYVRVRNIQLGYSLPVSLLSEIGLKKAKLYVSLNNFFTFTNYPGVDPVAGSGNVQSLGIDRGVYPVSRSVMTGVSLSF